MNDAPACGFDQVNVTVQKIRVHQSSTASENDGGWTDITLTPSRKINLLNLTNGALEELGQASLAAGQRVDLVLDFDACRSVVAKGNGGYALKPVIKVIPTVLNGINGFVDPAALGG